MAKKIRFPLKMKNGAEVRTLDELKENFDLESVLGYFTDGKLSTWLADRYYDEKSEAVAALSADMPDLNAKLCKILEVEYEAEADETDVDLIARRREKLQIISGVTDNREILDNIDLVAMDQDELFDILDESPDTVYLYGDKFEIPFGKKNISYIGINKPLVIIDKSKYSEDFEESGISFRNVEFEEGAFQTRYLTPVGEYEIEGGVLYEGKPDSNGVCVIPHGVKTIDDYAFSNCKRLTDITIPECVDYIGEGAFSNCTSLTDITIPKNVEKIGDDSFSGCTSLKSVIIQDGVKKIGDLSFEDCTNLSKIVIPESIIEIGYFAFSGCDNLTDITLPDHFSECDLNRPSPQYQNVLSYRMHKTSEKAKQVLETEFGQKKSIFDNEKRKLLLEKYPEPELLNNIDAVAFNEDDIISIIEKGIKEIYLIDNEFQFPFKIDMNDGKLLKKDGTSLPLDILLDCKFIGKNASLHIDDTDCVGICQVYSLQFENINFIFADEIIELLFKGKVLKDVDVLLSIAESFNDSYDYKNAFDYYLMAAELGNPAAQQKIGQMYFFGVGVNQDIVQSTEWYRKAAKQGSVAAQSWLDALK